MKRIQALLISPFFYPEAISTGKYNTVLAKALRDRGIQVRVIASHPLYPAWKPQRTNAVIQGVEILRGGGSVRYPRVPIVRRAVLELWFAVYVLYQCLKTREKVGLVVAVFPPNLFLCAAVMLFSSRTRIVGIVHDLQVVMGFSDGGILKRFIRRLTWKIEGRSLRACDQLVFLSQSMALKAQELYGLDHSKSVVRYPFVTVSSFDKNSHALDSLFAGECDHVVYSGALGVKQNPQRLVELFRIAAPRFPNTVFHIFSEGPVFDALRKTDVGPSSSRIRFHPLVQECNLEELYARSTVQVIPQKPGTSDGCIPSKLPNAVASGCRILAICDPDSELKQLLAETDAGRCIESWDPELFVSGLEELLTRAMEGGDRRDAAVSAFLEEHFSLESLVDAIVAPLQPQVSATR